MSKGNGKGVQKNEELLWQQGREAIRLGTLYGLLDGTICTSREHAISANRALTAEYRR